MEKCVEINQQNKNKTHCPVQKIKNMRILIQERLIESTAALVTAGDDEAGHSGAFWREALGRNTGGASSLRSCRLERR